MTKSKMIAATVVLWLGGFGATAALAYVVNRPPAALASSIGHAIVKPVDLNVAHAASDDAIEPFVIKLPTVEIVGPRVQAPVVQQHQRDISQMHCSTWRPLEQGVGAVQMCD
jgi:hypothetical protein